MAFPVAQSNLGRELNVQQLDVSKISDFIEWDIYAQKDISFRHHVEENSEPRADSERYKLIAEVNVEAARAAFSKACSSTALFKIPSSIYCNRMFARDADEAYYLDLMHSYLLKPYEILKVEDLPILKVRLHSRYFSAFSRRQIHFREMYERRRLRHWIPGDCPDLEHFTDLQKASWFPALEFWFFLLSQPSALPIPLPLAAYYFHLELRLAERYPEMADSERVRRLRFCLLKEYCIMFCSTWWNELYYGGKAFVLKRETIQGLNEHCGSISDIAGKPVQAIIERMRMFADMPSKYHNWMCFADRSMENSAFIFAVKKVGVHDHTMDSGRRLWCSLDNRNTSVSRYSKETFKRVQNLQERVRDPDLEEIAGLLSLVRDQGWARYNSVRLGDLLQNMINLYRNGQSDLGDARRSLDREERHHDEARREFEDMRADLRDKSCHIEDLRRYLDDSNRRLDSVILSRDEAQRRLAEQEVQPHLRQPMPQAPRYHDEDAELRSPHYSPEHTDREMSAPAECNTAPYNVTSPGIPLTSGQAMISTNQVTSLRTLQQRATRGVNGSRSSPSQPQAPLQEGSSSGGAKLDAQPRKLPLIKVGYPFHKMPPKTLRRSAQTCGDREDFEDVLEEEANPNDTGNSSPPQDQI